MNKKDIYTVLANICNRTVGGIKTIITKEKLNIDNINIQDFIYKYQHKIPTIYIITNIENSKFYIGSTKNFNRRIKSHTDSLRINKHSNVDLQADFNKYGEDKFIFSTIYKIKTNIRELEMQYIKKSNPKLLYNKQGVKAKR